MSRDNELAIGKSFFIKSSAKPYSGQSVTVVGDRLIGGFVPVETKNGSRFLVEPCELGLKEYKPYQAYARRPVATRRTDETLRAYSQGVRFNPAADFWRPLFTASVTAAVDKWLGKEGFKPSGGALFETVKAVEGIDGRAA